MKASKKILSLLLALIMLLSTLAMVACNGDNGDGGGNENGNENGGGEQKETYTVSVKNEIGANLEGVTVLVYENDELLEFGVTDSNGIATFELSVSTGYSVRLSGIPSGHTARDSYSFTGNTALAVLEVGLIEGENLSGAYFEVGDFMYDFTVPDSEGNEITLSEIFESGKKMVMLNFWYVQCSACQLEFPYMETVYQEFKDEIEIIALNSYGDSLANIQSFKESMGLSFPMAQCPTQWYAAFNGTGYPTSVIIDRYGVVTLIETGALPAERPFRCIFEHFTSDNYVHSTFNSVDELVPVEKPSDYDIVNPSSDEIAGAVNKEGNDFDITYSFIEDDEYSWPFIVFEKDGVTCIKASNSGIDTSYSIINAEVYLEAGQVLGFDYYVSSELGADFLHVIVNGDAIYSISGNSEQTEWKSCYPCVATKAGTYTITLTYIKDMSDNVGEDLALIKDMRVVTVEDIDTATYLPCYPASSSNGIVYTYEEIFYNENDTYYHVGSENGPLLLINLMGVTEFTDQKSLYDIGVEGGLVVGEHDYYEELVQYCNHASNSSLAGFCTVNDTLYELLITIDGIIGYSENDNFEWLKACKYYQPYATEEQLEDPIKGLTTYSAYEATEGVDIETNVFFYDRTIMPRGLWARFVPTRSGVYRITSHNDNQSGVNGWIFDQNGEIMYTYEADERMWQVEGEVSMVIYMEEGVDYYIDIAFWNPTDTGYVYYDVEYVAEELELFRLASLGPFTYDMSATGDNIYDVIAGGISVVVDEDGYYREDLGLDENDEQIYGSYIYADFVASTTIFDKPFKDYIVIKNNEEVELPGMISLNAFNFALSETDNEILSYLDKYNGDTEACLAYLRTYWGEDFDANCELYRVDEVFRGEYHGRGENYTEEITAFLDQIITEHGDTEGCVKVNTELAEILQALMDKYTFSGVENSWLKLCYYFDYLGPNN